MIVGLRNSGPEYEGTRHNAGYDLLKIIAASVNVHLKRESKFLGDSAKMVLESQEVRLLAPTTFMNVSGQSVALFCNFYQISPAEILVIHDDLDLLPGVVRFKLGGGHGGHNGLRNIIQRLNNCSDFARIRIGIGHPGNSKLVSNYVLQRALTEEKTAIEGNFSRILTWLPYAVSGNWERAMTGLHSHQKLDREE
tara:strand:+ start:18076 stop:18660 length:585 start_codon:yes stop_codon:yes gene_type:complete